MIKTPEYVDLGNGYLFMATIEADIPSTEQILAKIRGGGIESLNGYMGAMKGDAEIATTRTILDFKTGIPQTTQKRACTEEAVTFRCSLGELSLADLKIQLGAGKTSTTPSGSATKTIEVTMTGVVAQYLGHENVSSVIVKSQDATPVTYVKDTDYSEDLVNGTITRIDGGDIDDGEEVNVTYTYTSVAIDHFKFGGQSSVLEYFLRFVHYRADEKLDVCDIFKAGPSGELTIPYKETDWNIRDVEFAAIADTSKPAGEQFYEMYREVAE